MNLPAGKQMVADMHLRTAMARVRDAGAVGCAAWGVIGPAFRAAIPFLPAQYRLPARVAARLADKACAVPKKARRHATA